MRDGKIRVGIMGLGQIGRHIYQLALEKDDIEIVAVADIGKPEIIEYLLKSDGMEGPSCKLQDNYLVSEKFRTRMLQLARPEDVPWDVLDVDCVVDATGEIPATPGCGSASARRRQAGHSGVASG